MRTRAVAILALAAAALLRPAAARATTATDICPDAMADPCELRREVVADPGSLLDFGTRGFVIKAPDGRLEVPTGTTLTISAGSMVVETGVGGRLRTGSGGGSTIEIHVSGTFAVTRTGSSPVGIDIVSNAEPCTLDIDAVGDVTIGGEIHAQGGETAGEVYIKTAGRMTISDRILADSGFFGGVVGLDATGPIELTADGDVDASDAVGFGSIEINSGASVISAGRLETKARFSEQLGCDGGTIGVNAEGDVTISGPIAVDGDLEGCVGGIVSVLAGGSIFVDDTIDLSGGPNGQGGSFVPVEAGGDFIQSAPILVGSGGLRGWGGEADIAVGGRLHVGALLDIAGGPQVDDTGDLGRGGELVLTAHDDLEIAGEIAADGADYGSLVFTTTREEDDDVPGRIVVTGYVHAFASADEGLTGDVVFEACEIEIASGGSVRKAGPASRNLLRASGPMRIAGTLDAGGSGANVLEYRDLTRPPLIVPGAVVSPTPTVTATPADPLRPCACTLDPGAAGFLCNDGNPCTQEACDPVRGCLSTPLAGEGVAGCDDGNACDGRETCAALACQPGPIPPADDGDPCTDDGPCDPAAGYVRTPKTGFGAATCRMERIESALAAASVPGDVSAKSLKKLRKLARTVRNAIEKAGAAGGKRRAKLLRAAAKKIQRLDDVIASPKTSITTQLSQTLIATTGELRGALTQLQ